MAGHRITTKQKVTSKGGALTENYYAKFPCGTELIMFRMRPADVRVFKDKFPLAEIRRTSGTISVELDVREEV